MMSTDLSQKLFLNADQEEVTYDGSLVTWRVSAYVFIRKANQLLLVKSQEEKLYDIVGGGIELGEDIQQALEREALEEAGARIQIGKLLDAQIGWFYHANGHFYQTLQLFYEASLNGELLQPTDSKISWCDFVPIGEVGTTYVVPPFVLKVLKKLI